MRPFVLIREMRKQDEIACEELVKNYILSGARQAFVETIFKEVRLCDPNAFPLFSPNFPLFFSDYTPTDSTVLGYCFHLLRHSPAILPPDSSGSHNSHFSSGLWIILQSSHGNFQCLSIFPRDSQFIFSQKCLLSDEAQSLLAGWASLQ